MIHIAVIYYSGFGHTEVQAKSVSNGAASINDVKAICYDVEQLTNDLSELVNVDAIIFGSPTYMGSVAAPFKQFMDNTSSIWSRQEWKDKIAAGFTNSHSLSGDKLNTLIQMVIFATQHSMIWIGQAEMDQSTKYDTGNPEKINRLGGFLGAMAQSENGEPSVTPPSGDLVTARKLGERVAIMAKQLTINKIHS